MLKKLDDEHKSQILDRVCQVMVPILVHTHTITNNIVSIFRLLYCAMINFIENIQRLWLLVIVVKDLIDYCTTVGLKLSGFFMLQ